jgi:RNA polymerase sigma-70 factor (ECF subfamily)
VIHADGGGRVQAIPRPVHGRTKVARLLLAVAEKRASALGGWFMRQVQVNGQPGAIASDAAGNLIAVLVLDIADGHIQAVRAIVNPDKLRHLEQETIP